MQLGRDERRVFRKALKQAHDQGAARAQEALLAAIQAVASVMAPAPASQVFVKGGAHAPAGGVSVQGKDYKGGQFIPGEVMAKATPEEKEAVHGKKTDAAIDAHGGDQPPVAKPPQIPKSTDKSRLARLPETPDEALALATALREDIVGSGDRVAEVGQCIDAADAGRSLHPDIEVWRGVYPGNWEMGGEHQIIKAGKYFIDVTADQFGGEPIEVFTQAAIDNGRMEQYAAFGRDKSLEQQYDGTRIKRPGLIESLSEFEHSDGMLPGNHDAVGPDDQLPLASVAKKRDQPKKPRTVEESHAHLEKLAKKGTLSPEDAASVCDLITGHTHAEIAQLKAKLGIKASGAKAEQAAKIAARLVGDRTDARKYAQKRLTLDEAKAVVEDFRANKPGAAVRLANALAHGLTTADLHQLRKHYGVKASGAKADLALKIAKKLAPAPTGGADDGPTRPHPWEKPVKGAKAAAPEPEIADPANDPKTKEEITARLDELLHHQGPPVASAAGGGEPPAGHKWVSRTVARVGPDGRDGAREFESVREAVKTPETLRAERDHWEQTAPALDSHPELTAGSTGDGNKVTITGDTATIKRTYPLADLTAVRRGGQWHLIGSQNLDAGTVSPGYLGRVNEAVKKATASDQLGAAEIGERARTGHTEFGSYDSAPTEGDFADPVTREAKLQRYDERGVSEDGRFFKQGLAYYTKPGVARAIKAEHKAQRHVAKLAEAVRVTSGLQTSKAAAKEIGQLDPGVVGFTLKEWAALPMEMKTPIVAFAKQGGTKQNPYYTIDANKIKAEHAAASRTPEPKPAAPVRTAPQPAGWFAGDVHAALGSVPPEGKYGDNKVFISHLWDQLRTTNPAYANISLQEFKSRLLESQQTGTGVTLSRADLVQAMDPKSVQESHVPHLGSDYHFVVAPQPEKPATNPDVVAREKAAMDAHRAARDAKFGKQSAPAPKPAAPQPAPARQAGPGADAAKQARDKSIEKVRNEIGYLNRLYENKPNQLAKKVAPLQQILGHISGVHDLTWWADNAHHAGTFHMLPPDRVAGMVATADKSAPPIEGAPEAPAHPAAKMVADLAAAAGRRAVTYQEIEERLKGLDDLDKKALLEVGASVAVKSGAEAMSAAELRRQIRAAVKGTRDSADRSRQ